MNNKPTFLKLIFLACALFIFMPLHANEGDKEAKTEKLRTKEEFKAAYEDLLQRRDALKEAKKSAATREEKQQLKEDIKDIKKEAKALKQQAIGGGIYIGAGALIIILLLILLL